MLEAEYSGMFGEGADAFQATLERHGDDGKLGSVCRVALESSLLDDDALHVCIVQLARPGGCAADDLAVFCHDRSRPVAVRVMKELLEDAEGGSDRKLCALAQANRPVLVVLPELALGSSDWSEIDRLVRQYPGALILCAGAGFVRGDTLKSWASAVGEGGTRRAVVLDHNENLVPDQLLNIGYCWIKLPAQETRCIATIKNFPEQSNELTNVAGLYTSNTILRIDAPDVTLFPSICADLINARPKGSLGRITESLKKHRIVNPEARSLVIGMLLQYEPDNEQWQNRIGLFVAANHRLLLCNLADPSPHGRCVLPESKDRWRNLSGIYAPLEAHNSIARHSTRALKVVSLGLFGAVLRETSPTVVGGSLRWPPFNAQSGKHVWVADRLSRIESDGYVAAGKSVEREPTEAARLVRRWVLGSRLNLSQSAARAANSWADELRAEEHSVVNRWMSELLFGPRRTRPETAAGTTVAARSNTLDVDALDALAGTDCIQIVGEALTAIAVLREALDQDSERREAEPGQLALREDSRNVLVWSDPERTPHRMKQELLEWMDIESTCTRDLLVFAKPLTGTPIEGPYHDLRRKNIGEPAPMRVRHIDEGARGRRVWVKQLNDVVSAFVDSALNPHNDVLSVVRALVHEPSDG